MYELLDTKLPQSIPTGLPKLWQPGLHFASKVKSLSWKLSQLKSQKAKDTESSTQHGPRTSFYKPSHPERTSNQHFNSLV